MLKKIATAASAIIVIGLMVVAILLVPAHWQIRSIAPELPTKADILQLNEFAEGPVSISYFVTSDQKSPDRTLSHSTFVIEWADGEILLIDPGMDEATAIEFGELFETLLGADPARFYGSAADFLGEAVDRVEAVGFTHLHSDHVQGIETLCAAREERFSTLHTPDQMTEHNLHTKLQSEFLRQNPCTRQRPLAAGENQSDKFPGVGIYPLGGHTPGSTMFAVPVDGKVWLLIGDIVNVHANLIENRGKGFVYSNLMVPEDEERLTQLRLLLADFDKDDAITAIVSHDAASIEASGMKVWPMPEPTDAETSSQ